MRKNKFEVSVEDEQNHVKALTVFLEAIGYRVIPSEISAGDPDNVELELREAWSKLEQSLIPHLSYGA